MSSTADDAATAAARIVADFYSGSAEGYETWWAPELLPLATALVEEVPLARAQRVLDAGAGVGRLLPEISVRAPRATVFGADVSHGMLARAPGDYPRVVMDIARAAFGPGSFDACILAFVLFHLADPASGLREVHRLLAPGGWIGTTTWGEDPGYAALEIWAEELDEHGAAEVDVPLALHDLVDHPDKMTAALDEAGFTSIRTWSGWYDATMTVDEFIGHRTGHGMSRRRFESLEGDDRERFLIAVRRRLADLTDPIRDRSEVVYAVGRRD